MHTAVSQTDTGYSQKLLGLFADSISLIVLGVDQRQDLGRSAALDCAVGEAGRTPEDKPRSAKQHGQPDYRIFRRARARARPLPAAAWAVSPG